MPELLKAADEYCSKGSIYGCRIAAKITGPGPGSVATLEDAKKSFSYFQKICELGKGCDGIGNIYWRRSDDYKIYDVEFDIEKGLEYYKKDCARGSEGSCDQVVNLYKGEARNGGGKLIDPDKKYLDLDKMEEFIKNTKAYSEGKKFSRLYKAFLQINPQNIEKAKIYALKYCEAENEHCYYPSDDFYKIGEKDFAKKLAEIGCNANDHHACDLYKKIKKDLNQ